MPPPDAAPPTVSVSAHATRKVLPDSFTLHGRVEVRADTSQDANAALARRYGELETAVVGLPASVSVTHGALGTYESGGRGRARWHAQRALTLTGTDLTAVAGAATALAAVADVAVDGPAWAVSPDNPVHDELQAEVVGEARQRATRYADALGATLGRLASLSDPGSGGRGGWTEQASALGHSGVPGLADLDLTPQALNVSAAVNATWYLVLPG